MPSVADSIDLEAEAEEERNREAIETAREIEIWTAIRIASDPLRNWRKSLPNPCPPDAAMGILVNSTKAFFEAIARSPILQQHKFQQCAARGMTLRDVLYEIKSDWGSEEWKRKDRRKYHAATVLGLMLEGKAKEALDLLANPLFDNALPRIAILLEKELLEVELPNRLSPFRWDQDDSADPFPDTEPDADEGTEPETGRGDALPPLTPEEELIRIAKDSGFTNKVIGEQIGKRNGTPAVNRGTISKMVQAIERKGYFIRRGKQGNPRFSAKLTDPTKLARNTPSEEDDEYE